MSKIFVTSVTFLGCWFVYASSPNRVSKLPIQGSVFSRGGMLACGLLDLALAAAMWYRELGTVTGLMVWAVAGLVSWALIEPLATYAPKVAIAAVVLAFIVVVVGGWYAWAR